MNRRCCAVTNKEDERPIMSGDLVYVCGLFECVQPFPAYMPLCASHRAMAEIKEIPVRVEKRIGQFRL